MQLSPRPGVQPGVQLGVRPREWSWTRGWGQLANCPRPLPPTARLVRSAPIRWASRPHLCRIHAPGLQFSIFIHFQMKKVSLYGNFQKPFSLILQDCQLHGDSWYTFKLSRYLVSAAMKSFLIKSLVADSTTNQLYRLKPVTYPLCVSPSSI